MTFLLPEKQTSGLYTPCSIFEKKIFADENGDRIKKKDSNNKDDEDGRMRRMRVMRRRTVYPLSGVTVA